MAANENEIMRATIKVEADTKEARDQIQNAMDDVRTSAADAGDAAETAAKKAEDAASTAGEGFASAATKAAVWLAAIQAVDKGLELLAEGVKAYQSASDVAAGRGNPFDPARIGDARARLADIEKDIKKTREEAQKAAGRSDNVIPDPLRWLTGHTESEYEQKLKRLEELEAEAGKTRTAMHNAEQLAATQAQKEADAKRSMSLSDRIERERIATLEGTQRIEAEKQAAMKKAREQYGDGEDTGELLRMIQVRYDREASAFAESEAKKTKAEADRIAERERREKEARERDAKQAELIAQRIADANAKAWERAMTQISGQFNSLFDAQMNQLTFTIEGLASNVATIANRRTAAGL